MAACLRWHELGMVFKVYLRLFVSWFLDVLYFFLNFFFFFFSFFFLPGEQRGD
jgi:hypothetical protein